MRVYPSLVISGAYHKTARGAMSLKTQKLPRSFGNIGGNNNNNNNTGGINGGGSIQKPGGLPTEKPIEQTEKQWQASFEAAAEKAAKGTDKNGKYDKTAVDELRKKYIATVSPDRAKIINDAVRSGNSGGMYYDGSTPVAYYSKDGWHTISTPAENAKGRAFDAAFDKYYTAAMDKLKNAEATPLPITTVPQTSGGLNSKA